MSTKLFALLGGNRVRSSMFGASRPLTFARDGVDWPNREASAFVEALGLRWHVQTMGTGPNVLMVHGTGASTHSWEELAPLLAQRFHLVAPDLPGHGFTQAKRTPDLSLPGMARAMASLLGILDFSPKIVIGHSAGAAILARLSLDGTISPRLFVSINGAFIPFAGLGRFLFPSMAKLLFLNPLAPRLFAWSADEAAVAKLLKGTGSKIGPRGVELYGRLLHDPGHVAGALGMMANWDLTDLRRDLSRLNTKVLLIVGENDKAVPPRDADVVAAEIPGAIVETIGRVGHLAHEERPEEVCRIIVRHAAAAGLIADEAGDSAES
jgi:magnesium chelatase accessory protein